VPIISLPNPFTMPISTRIPFSWRDPRQFVEAAKAGRLRIGGTGARQQDQVIAAAMQRAMVAGLTLMFDPAISRWMTGLRPKPA